MSHHIYQTEGFVVGSRNTGEANKVIFIFTKDLGLVAASAQGVRLLKSKLRYSLQDYSYSKISLVRGREVWRLTSAGLIEKLLLNLNQNSLVFARGLSMVKRLVNGEEKNEALFDVLKSASDFLHHPDINSITPDYFECILMIRILHTLGYIQAVGELADYLDGNDWPLEMLEKAKESRILMIAQINQALQASQL